MENQNLKTSPQQNVAPQTVSPQSMPQQNVPPQVKKREPSAKVKKIRRIFFQVLIGCLVASAGIGVIAVLTGGFSDTLGRAIGTIALVALHAALSFGYISENDKRTNNPDGRSTEIFSNAVFTLLIASFITSQFGIWKVLSGEMTLKLYLLYGVLLFATLHADVLYRIRRIEKKIDYVINSNYVTMTIVVLMLTVVIFVSNASDLGDFYYRILAAIAIIDTTMTIAVIIMRKLYLQKYPELAIEIENSEVGSHQKRSFWKNPLVIVLEIYLVFQVFSAILFLIFYSIKK